MVHPKASSISEYDHVFRHFDDLNTAFHVKMICLLNKARTKMSSTDHVSPHDCDMTHCFDRITSKHDPTHKHGPTLGQVATEHDAKHAHGATPEHVAISDHDATPALDLTPKHDATLKRDPTSKHDAYPEHDPASRHDPLPTI